MSWASVCSRHCCHYSLPHLLLKTPPSPHLDNSSSTGFSAPFSSPSFLVAPLPKPLEYSFSHLSLKGPMSKDASLIPSVKPFLPFSISLPPWDLAFQGLISNTCEQNQHSSAPPNKQTLLNKKLQRHTWNAPAHSSYCQSACILQESRLWTPWNNCHGLFLSL